MSRVNLCLYSRLHYSSANQNLMTGFFDEVKRRKVYRVAAAYIIAAGGIIQLASATFPAWELPNWALRLVILLLLVGFPIALILAWAFDITPEGIRATPDTVSQKMPRRRNVIVLVATGVMSPPQRAFSCCLALPPTKSISRSPCCHLKISATKKKTPISPMASRTMSLPTCQR